MKKILASLIVCIVLSGTTFGYDWSSNPGDGTDGNPYQISTAEQLTAIGSDGALLAKCFMLVNDIDLAGAGDNADGSFSKAVIAPYPLGFIGKFSGNGYAVKNLTITPAVSSSYYYALFGSIVGQTSCVRDIRIENFTFNNYYGSYIGALAGWVEDATIENCFATGTINTLVYQTSVVGGLVGYLYGTVQAGEPISVLNNCGADVTITTASYGSANNVGGLVGYINAGKVVHCVSASRLSAESPYYFGNNRGTLAGAYPQQNGIVVDSVSLLDAAYEPIPSGGTGVTVLDAAGMIDQTNFEALGFDFSATWTMGENYPVLQALELLVNVSQVTVTEDGQASFDVLLANAPEGDLTVTVTIDGDPSIGLAAGSETLTFTAADYDTPQTITLVSTADDDDVKDISTVTLTTPNSSVTLDVIELELPYDWSTNPGDGSDANPYRITRAKHLYSIGNDPDLLDKCFVLMNDIDLAGTGDNDDGSYSMAIIAPDPTPGNTTYEGNYFTGKFYGNGHTISNYTINVTAIQQYYVGLFGIILGQGGNEAFVRDLRIENFTINGDATNYMAGLAGVIQNASAENCSISGTMSTTQYACPFMGGAVGQLLDSEMRNCVAEVTFVAGGYNVAGNAGGLIGMLYSGSTINCIAMPHFVTDSTSSFGTSAGLFTSTAATTAQIIDCVCREDGTYPAMVSVAPDGLTTMTVAETLIQTNFEALNYNFDNIWQMGEDGPELQDVEIIVLESSLTIAEDQQKAIGIYLANEPMADVTITVSVSGDPGVTVVSGSESLTFTPENYLILQNINIAAADDEDYESNDAAITLTSTLDNLTIPVTKVESVHDWANDNPGSGTIEDPYLIWTIKQLMSINAESELLRKHYKLIADIDLSGVPFDRAVISPDTDQIEEGFQGNIFTGTFDGNGHVISNLTITTTVRTDYIGLFGYIASGTDIAAVRDLGVENVNFNLAQGTRYIGSIVGYTVYGLMQRCYANGAITVESGDPTPHQTYDPNLGQVITTYTYENVTYYVGGLVGQGHGQSYGSYPSYAGTTGLLEDCYADVDIACVGPNLAYYAGGIVASSIGSPSSMTFRNCYAMGTVSSTNFQAWSCAGFLGDAGSGNFAGSFTSCFWDTESTTQAKGVMPDEKTVSISYYPYYQTIPITYTGVGGLTTAQMADYQIFDLNGWDFAGETDNGENDYWKMTSERPVLYFENGITIDKPSVTINENGQETVQVSLESDPLSAVTVTVSVIDDTDIVTDVTALTFDSGNFDTPQTVTISALDDTDYLSSFAYVVFELNGDIHKLLVCEADDDNDPDYNKDAWFNLADFAVLAKAWQTTDLNANLAGDTFIGLEDLVLFAEAWEPVKQFYDDFETGDLTRWDWLLERNDGGCNWTIVDTITDSAPYAGTYCAMAYGGAFDVCTMRIENVDVSDFNTLRFAYKTSSEGGYDKLRFYVQKQGEAEVEVTNWSGEIDWMVYEYAFEPGIYTFKWAYTKDSEVAAGQDQVWLDNIEFLRIYR